MTQTRTAGDYMEMAKRICIDILEPKTAVPFQYMVALAMALAACDQQIEAGLELSESYLVLHIAVAPTEEESTKFADALKEVREAREHLR